MTITMGWLDMFTTRKDKQVDALVKRVEQTTQVQEASFSRLELTIQNVIDAKTGRGRYDGERLDFPRV